VAITILRKNVHAEKLNNCHYSGKEVMSSRIQLLIDELKRQFFEKPGDLPDREPDLEFVVELHSTWTPLASYIYEALVNSGTVGEYVGPDYAYLINYAPYAESAIILKWWGDKKNPRIVELKRTLREFVRRAIDVYWEDITASRIKKEIELLRAEILDRAKEPIKRLLTYYTGKVPFKVITALASADIDYDPESNCIIISGLPDDYKGHVIGKQGAKVKQFEEETGYKLKLL